MAAIREETTVFGSLSLARLPAADGIIISCIIRSSIISANKLFSVFRAKEIDGSECECTHTSDAFPCHHEDLGGWEDQSSRCSWFEEHELLLALASVFERML